MLRVLLIVAGVLIVVVGILFLAPQLYFMARHTDTVLLERFVKLDGPDVILSLELRDERGEILWAIENPEGRELEEVEYGVLPEGFIQTIPATDPPRSLLQGEPLLLVYYLSGDRFMHIRMRPVSDRSYLYGTTIQGDGCGTPECVERLLTEPWAVIDPQEGR